MTDLFEDDRLWLPDEYHDEVIPPPRKSPNDWIEQLDDGAFVLADPDAYEDAKPRPLTEGEIIAFGWVRDHGSAVVLISSDGTWACDPEPLDEVNCIWDADGDVLGDTPEDFVRNWMDCNGPPAEEIAVEIDCREWSRESVQFVFRDGKFEPITATAGAA